MNRKNKPGMKIRCFDLDVKSVNTEGAFKGYGSVFGVVDSYGEVVAPGAFANSLKALADKGRTIPILWQHRTVEPIGSWVNLKEDANGLLGDGELWLEEAPNAKVAYKGMQTRSITGLSIGYYVIKSSYNEKTGIRTLEEVDLVEISIVTTPANDEARIDLIKSKIAHGNLPELPEFEKFLREAGFSKTQSTVIANRGLKHLLQSESASDRENEVSLAPLAAQLNSFSLSNLL
jgi:HK97 family phage prohead protease